MTVNGHSIGENCAGLTVQDRDVIRTVADPLVAAAGFQVMSGNLFRSAVMKISVVSDEFRARYLSDPDDPDAFEGTAIVFDGPEDYHARIDDPDLQIDEHSILVMRGTGPIAYPGSAEVVNMHPPARLVNAGITSLPCIGDGRQSGTSASPSILNCAPEAALPGSGSRCCAPATGCASTSARTCRRPPRRRGARATQDGAEGRGRVSLSRPPDAVAGDPAFDGRPARRGHDPRAGRRLPARRAEPPAPAIQPLSRPGMENARSRSDG